jgi:hypothetical protein
MAREQGTHDADTSTSPVAQTAKSEAAATKSEFSDLAGSRQKPDYTASNASFPALGKTASMLKELSVLSVHFEMG